jgi:hypothetical protein
LQGIGSRNTTNRLGIIILQRKQKNSLTTWWKSGVKNEKKKFRYGFKKSTAQPQFKIFRFIVDFFVGRALHLLLLLEIEG